MRGKRTNNIRIGSIGVGVLGVVAVAGAISVVAVVPGVAVALAPFLRKKKYSPKQMIQKNVDSLLANGLLKYAVDKEGERSLTLTNKGRWEVGIRGLNGDSSTSKKWDHKWRMVIFDVPEHKTNIRNELRRALTLRGFHQLQKSVWVYPHPCEDFIELVKGKLGIDADVLYMIAEYIENDKELKREFGLL